MKRYSFCVLALVFFAACANERKNLKKCHCKFGWERGPRNQPSLKVDGKTKAGNESEADRLLFEKQGYVVASDRFLQMDLLRRRCQGRLAELLGGVKAQEADALAMGIGLLDAVEGSNQKLQFEHPEVYEQVEAFARGVNQFISEAPTAKPELIRQYRALTRDPNFQNFTMDGAGIRLVSRHH